MSNARNASKLINKFSPTASGVDLTGDLDVSGASTLTGNITAGANIGLSATGVINGGPLFSRVLRVHELNNSSAASTTASTLSYDTSDVTLTSPYLDDGTDKFYRIMIESYGNARYLEASADPGWEPHLQVYNFVTAAWANFSDTDNHFQSRFADYGTNYVRSGYYISGNLNAVSTQNYIQSYATPLLRMKVLINGHGGTSSDDLDAYYNHFRVWELS